MRGGEATSGEFSGEDGTTLTFWFELPRGQGEGIGRTSWREAWSVELFVWKKISIICISQWMRIGLCFFVP